MAPDTMDVLSAALALPVRDRARLAHDLILSLDDGTDADASEAWVAEIERRATDVLEGSVSTESWESVQGQLSERWRRR